MTPRNNFEAALFRSNKELREDRGQVIVRNAEKAFRRKVEDLQDQLTQLESDRDNLIDLNPGNTQVIINPSEFDQNQFVESYNKIGLKIREVTILHEVAKAGYEKLFGQLITDSNEE